MKWVKVSYNDFNQFTKDQELLISIGEVDYLEGFIDFRSNSSNNIFSQSSMDEQSESKGPDPYYTIELALYYNDKGTTVQKVTLQFPVYLNSKFLRFDEL